MAREADTESNRPIGSGGTRDPNNRLETPDEDNGAFYPTYPTSTPQADALRQQWLANAAPASPTLTALEPQDMRFASDMELTAYIQSNYGYFASFLNDPEMKSVLFEAARDKWDEGRLYARVTQTAWWQNTSAAGRTWQKLQAEDPAEARRQVAQTAATIQNRARSLGLPMSSGQIASLAQTATENGWTDTQVVDNLVKGINWNTLEGGDLTASRDTVKEIGGDYLVKLSDSTAQDYAVKIASGEMSAQGVQSIMLKQAKARFGWMAEELDQGATVKDFFAPIRDTIARELEMAPEDVDMMDPKWLSLMETTGDDGKLRASTLNEAMLGARRKPEWQRTNRATELTANVSTMIGNLFGRSAV